MEDLRKQLRAKGIKDDDEHCVIYAMFPQQLEDLYTKPRDAYKLKSPADKKPRARAFRRRSSTSQSTASGSTSKSACSAGLPRSGNAGRKGSAFFLRNADFDVSIFPPMA